MYWIQRLTKVASDGITLELLSRANLQKSNDLCQIDQATRTSICCTRNYPDDRRKFVFRYRGCFLEEFELWLAQLCINRARVVLWTFDQEDNVGWGGYTRNRTFHRVLPALRDLSLCVWNVREGLLEGEGAFGTDIIHFPLVGDFGVALAEVKDVKWLPISTTAKLGVQLCNKGCKHDSSWSLRQSNFSSKSDGYECMPLLGRFVASSPVAHLGLSPTRSIWPPHSALESLSCSASRLHHDRKFPPSKVWM